MWPDNLSDVSTDLTPEEFAVVKFAIDTDLVKWDEKQGGLFGACGFYPFDFNGRNYELQESYELVTSLKRKE